MDRRFEKLKQMGPFTEAMFNRMIAFQEKEHAAWDVNKPFAERIKDLSLHNLIFSNPDRDPAKFGPTIAHYYPMREENRAFAYYAKHVANAPIVLDVHARNGFIGSLLAREGLKVIGLRDPDAKPNQIAEFYDADVYELCIGTLEDVDFEFDVAFSAWMPSGINSTPEILKHKPKLIVFVYTEHVNEYSKQRQTGTPEAFDQLPSNYKIVDEWSIQRPENMLHEAWPDLSPSLEETRIVRIYADEPFHAIERYAPEQFAEPYDWERELEMALLALEAKQELRDRGIAV
ncbi:MAG: hypothetical protein HY272_10870 [Gammaproteobacteria bacterium]|nr:hypothetical protein [Gammaproteobacteria bacterium]